jgi:hypothetical protein
LEQHVLLFRGEFVKIARHASHSLGRVIREYPQQGAGVFVTLGGNVD